MNPIVELVEGLAMMTPGTILVTHWIRAKAFHIPWGYEQRLRDRYERLKTIKDELYNLKYGGKLDKWGNKIPENPAIYDEILNEVEREILGDRYDAARTLFYKVSAQYTAVVKRKRMREIYRMGGRIR